MDVYNPHFRLFLLAVNTLFITACLLPAIGGDDLSCESFPQLLVSVIYLLWMIGALPVLAAMSLGWAGNFSLKQIAQRRRVFLGYCQLALILAVNTLLLGMLLSHEFRLLGLLVDVRLVHFAVCVGLLMLAYQKVLFYEHLRGCCNRFTQWLAH